jgi:hypothetical protein
MLIIFVAIIGSAIVVQSETLSKVLGISIAIVMLLSLIF